MPCNMSCTVSDRRENLCEAVTGKGDFTDICRAATRGELLSALSRIVRGYSLAELQDIRGQLEQEFRHLPAGYRRRLYPKVMEQVFGTHHLLLVTSQKKIPGSGDRLPPDFVRYCDMAVREIARAERKRKRSVLLYYLLAAFNLFVASLPGHPVGTPFPGGSRVELENGVYYCPIRDKEDDVESSICPFCPARQKDP